MVEKKNTLAALQEETKLGEALLKCLTTFDEADAVAILLLQTMTNRLKAGGQFLWLKQGNTYFIGLDEVDLSESGLMHGNHLVLEIRRLGLYDLKSTEFFLLHSQKIQDVFSIKIKFDIEAIGNYTKVSAYELKLPQSRVGTIIQEFLLELTNSKPRAEKY